MTALVASLLLVTLAEMGDKTQLLAMAFATRFAPATVLCAVFAATLLNHGLAVVAGRLLTTVIPLEVISLVGALSFILFGLWTLRGDALAGEDKAQGGCGPFVTVAVAFFIAELGDKTQLATISLAVRYPGPLAVLTGTTAGMVTADGIGIVVGTVLGKRLPEAAIRVVSAGVFIFFGLAGTAAVLGTLASLAVASLVLGGVALASLGAAHALLLRQRRAPAARQASAAVSRLPQSVFLALLAAGWVASLGWATPAAAVDHWLAFVLLSGVGWKLIHGAMRARQQPQPLPATLLAGVVAVTAAVAAEAVYRHLPASLAVLPVSLLGVAVAVLLGGRALAARSPTTGYLELIALHRVAVASGLLAMGAAITVVLEHLAATP